MNNRIDRYSSLKRHVVATPEANLASFVSGLNASVLVNQQEDDDARLPVRLPPTMTSVLNQQPSRLDGPELLHQLVYHSPTSSRLAVDALLGDSSSPLKLSYDELHRASDDVASRIHAVATKLQGCGPPIGSTMIIPVLIRQSPLLYVVLLGILKAGAAFCPLNLDAPPERVSFILHDVDAKIVITTAELEPGIPQQPQWGGTVMVLDDGDCTIVNPSSTTSSVTTQSSTPIPEPDATKLAYVMYTSGSTGTPKGVGVSHGAATQSLLAHDRHIPRFSRFLQFAAPTFDVSVFEIFFPLFRGATLVSCDRATMLNDLPAVIRDMEVDACELTPTVAGSLLRSRAAAPGLRLLLTIGEMLSEPVIREFGGSDGRESMLWAMYGPTEAAIHCTLAVSLRADSSPGNIGIPLDTVSCFILPPADTGRSPQSLEPLPVGEVGELVVGGHQLASGYVNRPEQTSHVFIDSPFGPLYRTGDLARITSEGSIECLGRINDGQVKLRGQRIELGEIEQVVLRAQGCHGAVAAVINQILVVFCAVDAGFEYLAMQETVLATCQRWLPEFMIPGDIAVTYDFPRLASGKVDRKRLKAEYNPSAQDMGSSSVGERDDLARQVAKAAAAIIGSELNDDTSLSSVGLNSLEAIKLASSLRSEGLPVSALDVLGSMTLRMLCSRIRETLRLSPPQEMTNHVMTPEVDLSEEVRRRFPHLTPHIGEIEKILPCTPLQRAMIFETSLDSRIYCNYVVLQFPESCGLPKLAQSIRTVVRQNEILRTGFAFDDNNFFQIVFREMADTQVTITSEKSTSFALQEPDDFLRPLRFELMPPDAGSNFCTAHIWIHHAIYDGWSLDMLIGDISAVLNRQTVPPRPQFSNVVSFYEMYPALPDANAAKSFWSNHLLGWQKPRPPKLLGRSIASDLLAASTKTLDISRNDIANASMRLGCSPQVFFQAATIWLWAAITGSPDVVLGSVTSGRTIPVDDVERVMGPCIASLPLRVNVSTVDTVTDLLLLIQANNRAILSHASLSLGDIARIAGLGVREQLYDLLFVYQESLENVSPANSGVRVTELRHMDAVETKIVVEIVPIRDTDGFSCQVTFHETFVTKEYVDIMIDQISTLVGRLLLTDQHSKMSSFRDGFEDRLLSLHRPRVASLSDCPDLASIFEQTAELAPNAPALIFARSIADSEMIEVDAECLSYSQLNENANRLAHWIQSECRVGTGKTSPIIAIIMDKSPLLYTAILAIIKAGFGYLPLLPTTPTSRVKTILQQAQARLVIVNSIAADALQELGGFPLRNISILDLSKYPNTNLSSTPDPERPAYIIYTSGTTGVPKGVVVTQRNIVSNLEVLSHIYPVDPTVECRLLQACSQAFDVSVFEIFFTWAVGMCLCAASNDTIFADLEHAIRALHITHLSLTPTVASLVHRKSVPCVKFLVTAGEAMTPQVYNEWKGVLYQGYGPSETTNICTVKKMEDGDYIEHLGHAFENTSTVILYPDSTDTVVRGGVGELCFGGDQVAQGYLNAPDLTSSRFINHPVLGKIYRSGDLGRMLADGSLVILGRIDDQLKLRGQRIEVGEIKAYVCQPEMGIASSCEVMLVSSTDSKQAKNLAVFYMPSSLDSLADFEILPPSQRQREQEVLFGTLRAQLPAYMVPTYLIPITSLPQTSSGKVDRRRLESAFRIATEENPLAFAQVTHTTEKFDFSPEETTVAKAVVDVIGFPLDLLDRWTPLVAAGIDSISAIALSRSLSTIFGRRVEISSVLQNLTVAQLTKLVQSKDAKDAISHDTVPTRVPWPTLDVIKPKLSQPMEAQIVKLLPCTALQEAMLASRAEQTYHNKLQWRIMLPIEKMMTLWHDVIRRHSILRTCFHSTSDARWPVVQVVLKEWMPRWRRFDEDLPAKDCLETLEQAISEPLNSMSPPLAFGFTSRNTTVDLYLACHHAVYDGVAMERLLLEIEQIFLGRRLEPTIQYDDFLEKSLVLPPGTEAFWRKHLDSYVPKRLQYQGPSSEQRQRKMTVTKSFHELERKLKSLGVTLLSFCQAVWANFLSIMYDDHDVCFGNIMSGRTLDIEGIDRLVAPCFNSIPVRENISRHGRCIDLVRYFQELNPELLKVQFTPLRSVQKIARSGAGGLFDSLLLLQSPTRPLNAAIWEMVLDEGKIDLPLVWEIRPNKDTDRLDALVHYDVAFISDEVMDSVAVALQYIFDFMITYPSSTLRSLADLPGDLRHGITLTPITRGNSESLLNGASNHVTNTDQESWSEIERRIRHILSNLSGVEESIIRRDTTIFQLGLDSINAVQIAATLRQSGFTTTVADVMESRTSANLAKRLTTTPVVNGDAKQHQQSFSLEKFRIYTKGRIRNRLGIHLDPGRILPCTPVQVAMLTDFVHSSGRDYFNYLQLDLNSGITASQIMTAWSSVSKAHPILRTGFVQFNEVKTEHASEYAMVQYLPDETELPVSLHSKGDLDVLAWRKLNAKETLDNLEVPPWHVAIVEDGASCILHIVIHHALYDAYSLELILDDLSAALRGCSVPSSPSLEATVEYILTATKCHNNDIKKSWEALSDNVVINQFPTMTPLKVEEARFESKVLPMMLPSESLQTLAKAAGVTMQAALEGAWVRVLASYLGEDSVVFGVVMSGRTSEETRNTVFPCITTLPIIARNTDSNAELLTSMMDYNSWLHKNPVSSLNDVQRWLGHPGTRLFDTILVYQRNERHVSDKMWSIVSDEGFIDCPVSLEVEERHKGEISLRITFTTNILPTDQAVLLLQQFEFQLRFLLANPAGQLKQAWKDTPGDLMSIQPALHRELTAPVRLLHEFVELQALRQPNKMALEFVDRFENYDKPICRTWMYSELNDMGDKVATLIAPHITPGSIVAVHFEKCPEAYFAILGILKSGCAFLALDPSAPPARKSFILRDSNAQIVLTDSSTITNVNSEVRAIQITEEILQAVAPRQKIIDENEQNSQDACYCLYTSGTTGTPKGCVITHENTVQAMMAFQNLFSGRWNERSRCLQFASLHFDVSVLEQYWSWSVGITVVSAHRDTILDDLERAIKTLNISHIDLTPSLASLVRPEQVPSLWDGVFITGGEQLKQDILDTWGPKGVIYNAYGPTEATIGVTMRQQVPRNGRPANIGAQFPNVGSYVLQPGTEIPVPRGAVGELCISGKLVGQGYLGRPELTAEKFFHLSTYGERIYRTGDLVRLLCDGSFDFLGRADDQVKLRGQRLEIGEINHAIRSGVTDVSDVVTIVTQHMKTSKDMLVSFVVSRHPNGNNSVPVGEAPSRIIESGAAIKRCQEAKAACRQGLPSYMVPTYVIELSNIPLSRNNKAEHKVLRELFGQLQPEDLARWTANDGGGSSSISWVRDAVFASIMEFGSLQMRDLTPLSSIWEFGVDSISVPRFSRILKKRGLSGASSILILQNPVLGDLVGALGNGIAKKDEFGSAQTRQRVQAYGHRYSLHVCNSLNIPKDNIEYIAPLTPLQEGMISRVMAFNDESSADSPYFNSFALELLPGVSTDRLKSSWDAVINAHPILRTCFVHTPDGYVQVSLRKPVHSWECHISDDSYNQSMRTIRTNWVRRNKEHIATPLEFSLISVNNRQVLIVCIFHALYDGISLDLILRSVASQYQGVECLEGPQFIDVLGSGPLSQYDFCKDFWLNHFKDHHPISNHKKTVRAKQPDIQMSLHLPVPGLNEARVRLGVTAQALLLGTWMAVLRKHYVHWSTIGIIVSGRSIDIDNIDQTIGPLFNTLPFNMPTSSGVTLKSQIEQCHAFLTATLAFQHVPLKDIQKWCSGGGPLFDSLFVYQVENHDRALTDALWTVQDQDSVADYPIAFEVTEIPGGDLKLDLVLQGHVMGAVNPKTLLDEFKVQLGRLVDDADGIVIEKPLSNSFAVSDIPGPSINVTSSKVASLSQVQWISRKANILRREISLMTGLPAQDLAPELTLAQLGLDSIDIVRLSSKLRSYDIGLPASIIMSCNNIGAMVTLIEESDPASYAEDGGMAKSIALHKIQDQLYRTIGCHSEDIEMVLPATTLQQSMIAQMLDSQCEVYFNHDLLRIGPAVDSRKLLAAWKSVINASPILRTSFVEVQDSKIASSRCQVVWKKARPPVPWKTWNIRSMRYVTDVIVETKKRATALDGHGGLLQLNLIIVGSERFVLLSISHALYDGWSLSLLHEDVERAYHGMLIDRPHPKIFIESLMGQDERKFQEFWASFLSGAQDSLIGQPTWNSGSDVSHRYEITSKMLASELVDFGRENAVSVQTIALSCWSIVLASLTKSLDVTFGVVLAGREFEGVEDIMFPTMNTVALRCVLHDTSRGFMRYMEESMRAIRPFQSYPLTKALASAGLRGARLFDSLFLYQKSPMESTNSRTKLMVSVSGSSAVDYPVSVEMEMMGDQIIWRAAVQEYIMTNAELVSMLGTIDRILVTLTQNQSQPILTFDRNCVSACGLEIQLTRPIAQPPEPDGESTNTPWTETEEKIRMILSEMAGVEESSIHQSHTVYNLGLDSIYAIKVSAALRAQGVPLSTRDILLANSISEMAQVAVSHSIHAGALKSMATVIIDPVPREVVCIKLGIEAADIQEILPALPTQIYTLSAWRDSNGLLFYPEFQYRVTGAVSKKLLTLAWEKVVSATPLLRTLFVDTGRLDIPLAQIVVRPEASIINRKLSTSPNLPTLDQPLWHLTTAEDEDGWVVKVKIHHALYDAVSLVAIMNSFSVICSGETEPFNHGLAEWKHFCMRGMSEEYKNNGRRFWTTYLRNVLHEFPTTTQNGQAQPAKRNSKFVASALSDTSNLESICRIAGISIQSLFFAAFAVFYCKSRGLCTSGGDCTVVIGIYLANRTSEGLGAIYPTLNILPLKVIVQSNGNLVSLAKRIHADIHDITAPDHVAISLWEIQQWTGIVVDVFVNFLVDVKGIQNSQNGTTFEFVPLEAISEVTATGLKTPKWLDNITGIYSYPESLDVEAAVVNGRLDVGMFGIGTTISEASIQDIVQILRESGNT